MKTKNIPKKKSKKKTYKGSATAKWIAVLAAIGVVVIGLFAWYMHECRAEYQGEKVRIYIPKDATAEAVNDTLVKHLGDKFGTNVYNLWSWRDGKPQNAFGSYVVDDGDVAMNVARKLLTRAEDPIKVTFNNVRTIGQLSERISKYLAFDPSDFINACDSVLPELGYVREAFPAAFLPDTYEFYWTADPDYVVRRLVKVRDNFWTPERHAQAQALGLTEVQVATLASIVEEETAKADERAKVARLYLNRMDRGMKLQADPTVKFAVGDFSLRRITGSHLSTPSPYNTYLNTGLPPGPIRVVERATLDNVLYAPMHPYLYMCAKSDFSGYHDFAVTHDQHLANARRYHAALNARGIR